MHALHKIINDEKQNWIAWVEVDDGKISKQ